MAPDVEKSTITTFLLKLCFLRIYMKLRSANPLRRVSTQVLKDYNNNTKKNQIEAQQSHVIFPGE